MVISYEAAYDASLAAVIMKSKNEVRKYLAAIGKRGGLASRRELTRSHAKQMVAIREAKRAAIKAGGHGLLAAVNC